MDTMVLLVGDSRRYEDDDCACSHGLAGAPRQVEIDELILHVGDDAVRTVSTRPRSRVVFFQYKGSGGGNTQ